MALNFEDLLQTLCPPFEPQPGNSLQKIYAIADARAGKLAFDVLVAHGFEAKFYPDVEKGCKLYITQPPAVDAAMEQRWSAALAYGRTLHRIKSSLDAMRADEAAALPLIDYSITFANAPSNNKQVNILLTQAAAATVSQPLVSPTLPPPAQAAAAAPQVLKSKKKKKRKNNELDAGPTLGKHYYPGALDAKAKAEQNSFKRRMYLYITGNIATGSFGLLMVVVAIVIIFTFFVMAKSFLCPDFALEKSKQNHAWYCSDQSSNP